MRFPRRPSWRFFPRAARSGFPCCSCWAWVPRFAAVGLLLMTCVIELTIPDGWTIHITWAAMALGIATWGPGKISIDHLLDSVTARH